MEKGRNAARDARQEDSGGLSAPARFISVPAGCPREPPRLCMRVTSVQLHAQLACACRHLHAPEESGCKNLHCSHKGCLGGEHLSCSGSWEPGEENGGFKEGFRPGPGSYYSAKGPGRAGCAGRASARARFSPTLHRTFPPSFFPRSASLGAVSRDCLSHPFSFPP